MVVQTGKVFSLRRVSLLYTERFIICIQHKFHICQSIVGNSSKVFPNTRPMSKTQGLCVIIILSIKSEGTVYVHVLFSVMLLLPCHNQRWVWFCGAYMLLGLHLETYRWPLFCLKGYLAAYSWSLYRVTQMHVLFCCFCDCRIVSKA